MDRKRFVATAALTLAANQIASLAPARSAPGTERPFKIEIADSELIELRRGSLRRIGPIKKPSPTHRRAFPSQ